MLISNSIKDGVVDHDEFVAIIKEKKNYDRQKNEIDGSKLKEVHIV